MIKREIIVAAAAKDASKITKSRHKKIKKEMY